MLLKAFLMKALVSRKNDLVLEQNSKGRLYKSKLIP